MSESVIVVGAGTMGVGIAVVVARSGARVELVEADAAARERASVRIAKDAQRLGDPSIVERIVLRDAIPQRDDAMLAIEAVPERLELKREVFTRLAAALAPEALLATNTSSLAVAQIAESVPHPQRVLGLHFFNPPAVMQLVEVVAAPLSSDDALDRAHAFAERIGKTAIETADTPGFVVNRVARPFYLQSMRAGEAGAATIDELDALARAAGFKMGPFELMDAIGLDVNLATSESVYERLGADRLEPIALQRQLVATGRLGRKSGTGFYDYTHGQVARIDLSTEPSSDVNGDEVVALLGFAGASDELAALLEPRYTRFQRVENDELLDDLAPETTVLIDMSDGAVDRRDVLLRLDARFGPETIIFADAYTTDLDACAQEMRHPERLVGYGILGSLDAQQAVEIVDSDVVSDDALGLAQELFASVGKGVMLLKNVPGLFLGRVIGSIVNEAMIAIAEEVATPDDVDLAMRLGTNYPLGPIAWGREIGGRRIARILTRLAEAEGDAFAPHRSLWVLDVEDESALQPLEVPGELPVRPLL